MENRFSTLKYELISVVILRCKEKLTDIKITLEKEDYVQLSFILTLYLMITVTMTTYVIYYMSSPNYYLNQIGTNDEEMFDHFTDENEINAIADEILHYDQNNDRIIPCEDIIYDILDPLASLVNATKVYFKPERITQYVCNSCDSTGTTEKKIELKALPRILCVLLNRGNDSSKKNEERMTVNSVLDVKGYIDSESSPDCTTYVLKSFICHEGQRCDQGHYYTMKVLDTKSFVKMNDSEVSHPQEIDLT